jgi:hypothetical protein
MQFGSIRIENLVLDPAPDLGHWNEVNRAKDLAGGRCDWPQHRKRGEAGDDRHSFGFSTD